jgi:hypothetical protein
MLVPLADSSRIMEARSEKCSDEFGRRTGLVHVIQTEVLFGALHLSTSPSLQIFRALTTVYDSQTKSPF